MGHIEDDKDFTRQLQGLSEQSLAWLQLGLKISMMFADARVSGQVADLEFCRELSRRLYQSCETEEQVSMYRDWIKRGYFGIVP